MPGPSRKLNTTEINLKNNMVSYQVNGQHYNNVFLALRDCWKNNHELKFYCYDYEFDQFDWTLEPEASLDFLMTQHALALRERYERLILLWSGGTDSHTIYNIFKRNNIHIDELIIKAGEDSEMFPERNVDWIRTNHWDPTTIITRYDDHDTELRLIDLPNEDWVWKNKGDLLKYGNTSSADAVKFLCEKNHAGHTWKAIGGYEKPRLVYRDGAWYHRQLSMVLQPTMGHDYIEHFFFEPLIAIKQAHMVKHAVKNLLKQTAQPLYSNDWAEAKWDKDPAGYHAWATACGRHAEVYIGVSHTQKIGNESFDQLQLQVHGDWRNIHSSDQHLLHDLANNNPAAVNYLKGFHNLTSEFGFTNWLRDNGWFRSGDMRFSSLKFTWSKEYCIGA